ncbi:hypothetical protein ACH5RR_008483 [Cinchona calisaya]|uniref:Transposase-associated domain-containing protein n=1 Tax=Cinchona calisaya TaxID=153742 RepID=A0ABD3ABK9_9GENT
MEDRSWIFTEDRVNNPYFKKCLDDFLDFAYKSKAEGSRIFCPCKRCRNLERKKKAVVFQHVMIKGLLTSYTNWIYHGETPWECGQQNTSNIICEMDEEDDMQGLRHDAFGNINFTSAIHVIEEDFDFGLELENDVACGEETTNFFKLLKHAEEELYKGCEGSSREIGRALGKENIIFSDNVSWVQAHRYVLGNLEVVDPFRREHKRLSEVEKPRMSNYERERIHNETFHKWFKKHVEKLETSSNDIVYHKEISYLAAGPDKWVRKIDIYSDIQNEDGLSKHCNNDYSDDGIFTWVREDDDYSSSEDDLGYDNKNGDTSGDDDDFFDEFQQGDEDDIDMDDSNSISQSHQSYFSAKSHHLKSKPNQIPFSDHSEQLHSEPGTDASSDSEATKGVFDGPMKDDSSREDGANSGRGQAKHSNTWGTRTKLQLDWNESHQVIGPNVEVFATQLGIPVKDGNKLPLTCSDWRAILEGIKERFWEDIKLRAKTGMEPSELDVFIHSRQEKNGKQVDEFTSQKLDFNHTSMAQKQAFDDTMNEKIEAMHIQMSVEMDAKLCRFKDDMISHFEERIRNFAPLQREMAAPQQSLLRGSFEVGDGIKNQVEENDDEVNQSEKSYSRRVIHILRKQRTKRAHK